MLYRRTGQVRRRLVRRSKVRSRKWQERGAYLSRTRCSYMALEGVVPVLDLGGAVFTGERAPRRLRRCRVICCDEGVLQEND